MYKAWFATGEDRRGMLLQGVNFFHPHATQTNRLTLQGALCSTSLPARLGSNIFIIQALCKTCQVHSVMHSIANCRLTIFRCPNLPIAQGQKPLVGGGTVADSRCAVSTCCRVSAAYKSTSQRWEGQNFLFADQTSPLGVPRARSRWPAKGRKHVKFFFFFFIR